MDKPKKCKNCQWYGKPYWSIINPCDNCPNENDYKTIVQIDGVPVIKETLTEEDLIKGIDKLNETFKMNDDNLVLNNYERQRLFKLAYDMQIKINYLQTKIDKIKAILDMPQFEFDNIPCNYENEIGKLKEIIYEE